MASKPVISIPPAQLVETVQKLREAGNAHFKAGAFNDAISIYEKALALVAPTPDGEAPAAGADQLRATLLNNIAACKLKQNKFTEVTGLCTKALAIDAANSKALFRRAVAHKRLGNLKQALSDFIDAAKFEPTDPAIKSEIEQLSRSEEIVSGYGVVLPPLPSVAAREGFDAFEVLGPSRPFFITGQIPRIPFSKYQEAIPYMKLEMPVILEGCPVAKPAIEKWTLEYLNVHMGTDAKFEVHVSPSKEFKYSDLHKNTAKSALPLSPNRPPNGVPNNMPLSYEVDTKIRRTDMTFPEFYQKFTASLKLPPNEKREHLYLQQSLNEGVGAQIVADYQKFDWAWVSQIQKLLGFGQLRFNTMWIGEGGIITKAHYDEAQNLFAQISGRKLFYLFHPDQYTNMYLHPVHHYHDRQTQVDLDAPDLQKFPNFAKARGVAGIVGPGDMLYIPAYWFHYVKSLEQSVSLNFWFKILPANTEALTFPLNAVQMMAVRRNIEKMIGEAVGPTKVEDFLRDLTVGRFNFAPSQ